VGVRCSSHYAKLLLRGTGRSRISVGQEGLFPDRFLGDTGTILDLLRPHDAVS